jgi:hypothetical protein
MQSRRIEGSTTVRGPDNLHGEKRLQDGGDSFIACVMLLGHWPALEGHRGNLPPIYGPQYHE